MPLNDLGAGLLIPLHDHPVVFGVKLCGQRRRADQVTEQHRQLPSFRGVQSRVFPSRV